jgi:hypothetical protein
VESVDAVHEGYGNHIYIDWDSSSSSFHTVRKKEVGIEIVEGKKEALLWSGTEAVEAVTLPKTNYTLRGNDISANLNETFASCQAK